VSPAEFALLLVAGIVGGLTGSIAGLASLATYPALLAVGLAPVSANVTNTVALMFTAVGAAAGSRPELAGQRRRVLRLGLVTAAGGGAGAAVLLLTPPTGFEYVAPVLIAAGSLLILRRLAPAGPAASDAGRPDGSDGRHRAADRGGGWPALAGIFGVAVYIGYFGAAGGVLMLAVLLRMFLEPLARANALKNVISGLANAVAGVGFAIFGPVQWAAAVPLAAGFLTGGWIGPSIVRRLPARGLRVFIGIGGLAVAIRLGISTYR
jgi:uncharacterized membrane protein YfcA